MQGYGYTYAENFQLYDSMLSDNTYRVCLLLNLKYVLAELLAVFDPGGLFEEGSLLIAQLVKARIEPQHVNACST